MEWPQNPAVPPLYQTAAYTYHSVDQVDRIFAGEDSGYTYTRGGNPTSEVLGSLIADWEGGDEGVVTASGMGALLAGVLTLQPQPGLVVMAREIYGGTAGLIRKVLEPLGFRLVWVDTHVMEEVETALREQPGLLVLESMSNPLGRVSQLDEIIPLAHRLGARVLVDNTFATPYHMLPLRFGADLVAHSVTKFIGGHSDLILGALAGPKETIEKAATLVNVLGITPDPFAAWLALRGARTLPLRMERSSANAWHLARELENMAGIDRVYYPGLASHPDHEVAARLLQRGFGAILGIRLGGGRRAVERFLQGLKHVAFVPSLGDVMTTVSHPVAASHRELSAQEQKAVMIDEGVLRVSVGIEDLQDLVEDFSSALNTVDVQK